MATSEIRQDLICGMSYCVYILDNGESCLRLNVADLSRSQYDICHSHMHFLSVNFDLFSCAGFFSPYGSCVCLCVWS